MTVLTMVEVLINLLQAGAVIGVWVMGVILEQHSLTLKLTPLAKNGFIDLVKIFLYIILSDLNI